MLIIIQGKEDGREGNKDNAKNGETVDWIMKITIKDVSLNLFLGVLQLVKCIISILFNYSVLNRAKHLHKDIVLQEKTTLHNYHISPINATKNCLVSTLTFCCPRLIATTMKAYCYNNQVVLFHKLNSW